MKLSSKVKKITKRIGLRSTGKQNVHSLQKGSAGRQMVAAAVKFQRARTGQSGLKLGKCV